MKKTEIIKIRISIKEKSIIRRKSNSAGLSISAYLRNLGLYSKSTLQYDELILKEIKRIGININQIARAVNQGAWSSKIQRSLELIIEDLREELKIK